MASEDEQQISFPRDLAGELHRRMGAGTWERVRQEEADAPRSTSAAEARARLELVRPIPKLPTLVRLLDVAYVASLHEEEGRPMRCGFGFLSPEGALALGFGAYRFREPLPLRPSTLAKLAPAAEPGRTVLGVWEEAGELAVWGLIHHGDQTFAIDLEHKPPYFSARMLRPGTFTVHFDEKLVLLFARDHGHFFERGLDLVGIMRDRADIAPEVAAALCRLAHRMLAKGHGGTILVVDTDAEAVGLVDHPALTPASRPDRVLTDAMRADDRAARGELRSEGEPIDEYVQRCLRIETAHEEALDFVASLTAVDGALVLDSDLSILGAGATIRTPESAMPAEVVLEDPRHPEAETRVPIAALGGNRHRSAVCFCAQQAGLALALVASQDGDLSFFARRNDGLVHAIRPFELGFGL